MNKIKKHISLTPESCDILKLLVKSSSRYKFYSDIINDALVCFSSREELEDDISKIKKNQQLLLDLVKQLYSDLQIINSTDPNKNQGLKEFYNKRIKGHSNEK